MLKHRLAAASLIVGLIGIGYFLYASETAFSGKLAQYKFKLGLDLAGGTELTYRADTESLASDDTSESIEALRGVIERRVNALGVSEASVRSEEASALSGRPENRLVVELPGVTDIEEAVAMIGETPVLEFRIMKDDAETILQNASTTPESELYETIFEPTSLTGRYLERAHLEFDPTTRQPTVVLSFTAEGRELFATITRQNVGKVLAIFIDETPISMPVVREEITDGQAVISGGFTADDAQALVRDLNYGALPVPIELVGTQSIGASLGKDIMVAGVKAAIIGFSLIALFLVLWYRLPGFVAVIGLVLYMALILSLYKILPVTITAAGIAGFIMSLGLAVDANILVFERIKDELSKGKPIREAVESGFTRAWSSVRDSNISGIITAAILFWLGTSLVRGFALTLGIGLAVNLLTAIVATRVFLRAIVTDSTKRWVRFLFGKGITY